MDKIQRCYGSNFSSILPSVVIYWVFILQNNVCEVFNILHLEVMIIEIVLSMQFFAKQNNSSVFMLGLAGEKMVSSLYIQYSFLGGHPRDAKGGKAMQFTDFVWKLRKTGFCEGGHK